MLTRKEISHRHYLKYKSIILQKKKKYNRLHALAISVQRREYYINNLERFSRLAKLYAKTHCQELQEYRKKYELEHKQEKQIYNAEYFKINKEKITKYIREKCHTDINYRLASRLRTRIHEVLKGKRRSDKTILLIGCSIEQLKQHLESKFTSGMSWSNYGKWHVDHIRPCALFNLSKEEEQRKCFHYTNLQPLWARANISKGKKYVE